MGLLFGRIDESHISMMHTVQLKNRAKNKGQIRWTMRHNQMEMCATISEITLFWSHLFILCFVPLESITHEM